MRITKHVVAVVTVATLLFTTFSPASAQTGIPVPSMSQCDTLSQNFINTFGIQGMTISISYQGRLIYSRGFGWTTQAATEPVQPYHRMRFASISKTITALAIMKLVETGQLSLDETVFGPSGILGSDPYFASGTITDPRMTSVTVRNLLEHAAGWDPALAMTPSPLPPYPWGYPFTDPASFPLHVTQTLGETNPMSRRASVKWTMQRPLNADPNTGHRYSNVGYAILAQVIEAKTGMAFIDYLQSALFEPINANDFAVARSLLADKQEREVEYIATGTTLSSWGTGQMVLWQYGGTIYESVDGGGGLMGTASDYVRLLNAVDGFATKPDILTVPTLTTMTTPPAFYANYAKGWGVTANGFNGNWGHAGQLNGTATNIWRRSNQLNSTILMNEVGTGNFRPTMNNLDVNCFNTATSIPTHDLSDVPETPTSNLAAILRRQNSLTIDWQPGDGTGRVIVMRAGAVPNRYPLDGTNYTAPIGGPYTDLGGGNFVVYSGTGETVQIDGLQANTNYFFRVYEFNNSENTGNNSLYQLGRFHEASISTLAPNATGFVSGRVIGSNGRGVANATVIVRDETNEIVAFGRTSSFGFYRIDNVLLGNNYSVTASAKRENFSTVNVAMNGDLSGVDITAVSSTYK